MRHGAVIVRGGRVLAVGWNRSRCHDQWVLDRPRNVCTVHAEVVAGKQCDLRGATVIVIRLTGTGQLGKSRPCEACWAWLDSAGVHRVIHS